MKNFVQSFNDVYALPPKATDYYYETTGKRLLGWKMHLALSPTKDTPIEIHSELAQNISQYLIDQDIEHKFGNGADDGKTMAIYTGSLEKTLALAEQLSEKFDFPQTSDELIPEDLKIKDGIYMRFEGQKYRQDTKKNEGTFRNYGYKAIPNIDVRYNADDKINGMETDRKTRYKLHALVGHILCAELYGENYLGKGYTHASWDKKPLAQLVTELHKDFSDQQIEGYVKRSLEIHRILNKGQENLDLLTNKPISIKIEEILTADFVQEKILRDAQWIDVNDSAGDDAKYVDLSKISPTQKAALEQTLTRLNLSYTEKNTSLERGMRVIAVKGRSMQQLERLLEEPSTPKTFTFQGQELHIG